MASDPDTYEWTVRTAGADIDRAGKLIRMTGTSTDPTMLSIAHSLLALASMLHYAFADEFNDGAAEGVGDDG